MADTGGKRYCGGCAGRERGGATTARAVCAEVLSVVHGIAVGNPRAGNRTPRAEALAIGYGTLRYWTPQAAIGNRRKYSVIYRRAQDRLWEHIYYQMLRPEGADSFGSQ